MHVCIEIFISLYLGNMYYIKPTGWPCNTVGHGSESLNSYMTSHWVIMKIKRTNVKPNSVNRTA